jgi:NADPH-dependent F420 reductase
VQIGTIGIIGGTGSQGSGLAKRWYKEGYHVVIGSRSQEKGQRIAEELLAQLPPGDGSIVGGSNEFAIQADIVVLTIPADQIHPLIFPFKAQLKGKIILDVAVNIQFGKFPRAMKMEEVSVYEFVRELFPESRVVACLKTIPADLLVTDESLNQVDFQMTTDDEAASIAARLVESIGLNPIRIRGKHHAYTVERIVAMAIQINKLYPRSHTGYNLVNIVQ